MGGPFRLTDRAAREAEEEALAPAAVRSTASRGRVVGEPEDPLRTAFERDRDRILHAKAFRRLKHKTQVFLNPDGDHFVTRLTHTLQVMQVARSLARTLGLNETLTEAIALGHDLGHTPFGHLGEQALTPFLGRPFRHNEQSLRIVDHLENDGEGLNLCWEVRDGIVNHTWSMPQPSTPEAQLVRFADRIAYVNHDVDDAVRAGVIEQDALPIRPLEVLGATHSARINTLVTDLVGRSVDGPEIGLSDDVFQALDALREFLFDHVYLQDEARSEQDKAISMVRSLFAHYLDHPEEVPQEYHRAPGDLPTRVADYIAGMTDRYALRIYEQLFLPQRWLL